MQGYAGWSYRPYTEAIKRDLLQKPYIAAIRPMDSCCLMEWYDDVRPEAPHLLEITDDEGQTQRFSLESNQQEIALTNGKTFTFAVYDSENSARRSETRTALVAPVIGYPVNYLNPADSCYSFSGYSLCSPSILRLKNGKLLVSMDIYRCRWGQNLTKIFESNDNGKTWHFLTDLFPCFWGKLFEHQGGLFMLACTTEYGHLVIGRSSDGGKTWPSFIPLFPGSGNRDCGGLHKAPLNILRHGGRLWTAIDFGSWEKQGHANGVLSIAEDADPLCPENWTLSDFLPFQDSWPGAAEGTSMGCLEGNMTVLPDGSLVNFLRYQIQMCRPSHDRAVLLKIDPDKPEAQPTFFRIIDFMGGLSKFSLLYDEISGYYLALVNRVADPSKPMSRETLSLTKSRDAIHWEHVMDFWDLSSSGEGTARSGVQYPDAIIDGEDLLWVQRTAMNQAANFHDSNYITFHCLKAFRTYLNAETDLHRP